ncbi:hypothetical protein C8J56DRAFT_725410, partial [Mycena floridula]
DDGLPFGGLNVIICGDPHQFPPVANATGCRADSLGALYCTSRPSDKAKSVRGRALWEQFDTVVSLTGQVRVQDPDWNNMLLRLRHGACTEGDVMMVDKLV